MNRPSQHKSLSRLSLPSRQGGVALLEALVAILVFSLGILTVIAIQATSIRMAAEAQYRTKATLLADRLIGEMWASGDRIADLKTKFESGGDAYAAWVEDVENFGKGGLPGVTNTGSLNTYPTVSITSLPRPAEMSTDDEVGEIVVTLFWRTPTMAADERHQHTVISQIARNP